MARVSVNIPDDLVARLEPVKHRINVSQVCREALERRTTSVERAPEDAGDLEGLIERLRDEREAIEGRFEQLGRRNAVSWLSTASYTDVKHIAESRTPSTMEQYGLPTTGFSMMKPDMGEAKVGLDGLHAIAYKTAWLDQIQSVWAGVVDQPEGDRWQHARRGSGLARIHRRTPMDGVRTAEGGG